MSHYLELDSHRLHWAPLILLVPGINNSGPEHWQSRWEAQRGDCQRAELGVWDNPHRNTWVNQLNLAIHRAARPVLLVAHSLGCLAVGWWAHLERPARANPVVGALLVAPPDVHRPGTDARLARFALTEQDELPFPSVVVGSENDPYCELEAARGLAASWGSRFENAGVRGHINADSGLGDWPRGQRLLAELLRAHRRGKHHQSGTLDSAAQPLQPLVTAFRRYAQRKRDSDRLP